MATTNAHAQPAGQLDLNQTLHRAWHEPAYGSYLVLRIGFAALPILMGLDKFANLLTNWESYLAPWIVGLLPFSASTAMHVVGVIEIVAGILVAVKPRYFAYLVAIWLAAIIISLLTYSGYYDVVLRDFGLLLAALSLGRLSSVYDPAWRRAHS